MLEGDAIELTDALHLAGVEISAASETVVSLMSHARTAFASLKARRIVIVVEVGDVGSLEELATVSGFVAAAAKPLELLAAVARNPRRVTPEFWRRIFAWLEKDASLREAVVYGELLAARLLPPDAGSRVLLVFERPPVAAAPRSGSGILAEVGDKFDADAALQGIGLDPSAVARDVERLLRNDPRATVIAWFVAQTLCSPCYDALTARLLSREAQRDFDRLSAAEALDRGVSEIAGTWYDRIVSADVLRYRGLDLGYALEMQNIKELLAAVHFDAVG